MTRRPKNSVDGSRFWRFIPAMDPVAVLSIFPGADLLGRGFEREGFCVLRGPDLVWGSSIVDFHPPKKMLKGVIGGSPCPDFSRARRSLPSGDGVAMLKEFCRVVFEAQPDWFLLENVPGSPDIEIPGYQIQRFNLNAAECGGRQRRLRRFHFGSRDGSVLVLDRTATYNSQERTCMASEATRQDRRGFPDFCELQGLPRNFDLPGLSLAAKYRAVGNGVPVYMAAMIARAILDRSARGDIRLCQCGCGRRIGGRQVSATAGCRKRMERRRKSDSGVTELVQCESGLSQLNCDAAVKADRRRVTVSV